MYAIIAAIVVSLVSFIGIITISIKDELIKKTLLSLVGFSAGALIGGAFLHLIPEALEKNIGKSIFLYVIIGFSAFFVLERLIFWHHCHKHGEDCDVHIFTYMNLVGDGLHNFIDGMIIAAAFSINTSVGIATTVAIIAHEILQEIGDFAVLLHGGFSKKKALFFNFLSAIFAVVGAIFGLILVNYVEDISSFLIAIAAGGFLYIGASDLVPELHKEPKIKKAISSFVFFILGIVFMYFLKTIFE